MKLSRLYQQLVQSGIKCDPRDRKDITSYADTAILYGKPDTQIKKALVGIDIEIGELLLAEKIRNRQGLDLVIAHHPEGKAFAELFKVMHLQVALLQEQGISHSVALGLLDERMLEVERKILAQNHTRAVDAARLLDFPFMCVHTPADNYAFSFVRNLLRKEKPATLSKIIDILMDIEEYKSAAKHSAGPRIILGNPRNVPGKILVEMTGGTEGHKDALQKLYNSGVRTLVSMHLSEEHFKKAKDVNLNVVIAGHISSDTLGLNLLLDDVETSLKETLQIISCSGFSRIKRKK